jgi:hypothetical protein
VPTGALVEPTALCVSTLTTPPAGRFDTGTPVFRLEPSGLTFVTPITAELTLVRSPPHLTAFLSTPSGPGYDWLPASVSGGVLTTLVPHFSDMFAANGIDFDLPVDLSCTKTRLLEARVRSPAAIAMRVRATDCHGTPLSGLDVADFAIHEDGAPLSSEASTRLLTRPPEVSIITLVFDVSSSVATHREAMVDGAKLFVDELARRVDAPILFAIDLIDGGAVPPRWLAPTDDLAEVDASLELLLDFESPLAASTNLYGGLIAALERTHAARVPVRANSANGSLESGHVILFTDGRDTASYRTLEDALVAASSRSDQVIAVGLSGPDLDLTSLELLGRDGVYVATSNAAIATAFGAAANQVANIADQDHLIAYCSTRRAGSHSAEVHIGPTTVEAALFEFDASGFAAGCGLEALDASCGPATCGGFACGACLADTTCHQGTSCLTVCTINCANGAATNALGPVVCADECDSDRIALPADVCPFVSDPAQLDLDGDGFGDLCDDDDDGDGIADGADGCRRAGWVSTATNDHDQDGCHDEDEDLDDDGDGKTDAVDFCPRGATGWSSTSATDANADGCRDGFEVPSDLDEDGLPDLIDPCPLSTPPLGLTLSASYDPDDDGCFYWEDDDNDGDGVPDAEDLCPIGSGNLGEGAEDLNDNGCPDHSELDGDGDGIIDDACPRSPSGWLSNLMDDPAADGCFDAVEAAQPDGDGDGVPNSRDRCLTSPAGWRSNPIDDHDRDGCGDAFDADDDGDLVPDGVDGCPGSTHTTAEVFRTFWAIDHDGDGCEDVLDNDDDADGVPDGVDLCPRSTASGVAANGCFGDELGDRDDDGVSDAFDGCVSAAGWRSTFASDLDGDGCADEDDDDLDGDSVSDVDDACPATLGPRSTPHSDPDGDGCVDAPAGDADGDGLLDEWDLCPEGRTPSCDEIPTSGLCLVRASWLGQQSLLLGELTKVPIGPDGSFCIYMGLWVDYHGPDGALAWRTPTGPRWSLRLFDTGPGRCRLLDIDGRSVVTVTAQGLTEAPLVDQSTGLQVAEISAMSFWSSSQTTPGLLPFNRGPAWFIGVLGDGGVISRAQPLPPHDILIEREGVLFAFDYSRAGPPGVFTRDLTAVDLDLGALWSVRDQTTLVYQGGIAERVLSFDGTRAVVAGFEVMTTFSAEGAITRPRGDASCVIDPASGVFVGGSTWVDIRWSEGRRWPGDSTSHPLVVCTRGQERARFPLQLGPRTQVFETWLSVADGGVAVVAQTSDGPLVARFEPCDSAPACRDDDACTEEISTEQGCEHRRLDHPACR